MASISTDTYSLEHLCALANPKSIEHVRQLGDRKQLEAGLKTNLKTGLRNNEDHSERINKYGNNVLPDRQGKSFLSLVWTAFQDKVLIILSIAAAVSLAVGLYQTFGIEHENGEAKVDWVEGVAIMLAVVIVVLVGSINDYQKEKAFAKLNKKKEDRKMAVLRGGQESQTSIFDLMVGDILRFQTGDILPVDGLLLDGYNVKADESSQTGEIDQMKKSTVDATFAQIASASGPLSLKAQGDPILLSGSKIVDGNGTMIVTAVGIHSTYGSIMMSLRDGDTELTPLQSKLNAMAENIAIFAIASALLYFFAVFFKFIYRITRGDSQTLQPARKGQLFLNVFIESVSIVAVAIPEGLPLAVTLALAIATTRMFKDNNLVRLLASCETMGNASTICSDKTGTLTQNKMTVVVGNLGAAGDFGFGKSTGKSTDKADQTRVEEAAAPSSVNSGITLDNLHSDVKALLAQSIVTNSTASEEGEEGSGNFGGSVTEVALLRFAQGSLGIHSVRGERNNANIQAAIPFNSTNKYMATLVGLPENNTTGAKYRVHVKGAPDILLKLCTKVISRPTEGLYTDSMSSGKLDSIRGLQTNYAERSLRTLCVIYDDYAEWPAWFPKPGSELERADVTASKNNTTITTTAADGSIMGEMTFLGMVGIQDPLREGVPDAVKDCKQAGVVVRMVTGDNLATAKAIAIDSGILTGEPGEIVMEGSEFRKMSDGEMDKMLPHLRVLARAIPEDKRILVAHLKGLGEVVAVTGDGTNDAPALKLANVGFAMGSGTEVAKEASDIILLDDNFASIVKALLWGRTINDAVKKFLQFQLTVNVSAVITTFVSGVARPEPIMPAVQLLWLNLIMDTLAALALATDFPTRTLLERKPERKDSAFITTPMWKQIIGQAIYQLIIVFMMLFAGPPGLFPYLSEGLMASMESHWATVIFNAFVWMQIFNAFNCRRIDNHLNIFEAITKNWYFAAILAVMIGGQFLIIFVGGVALQVVRLNVYEWIVSIIPGLLVFPVGVLIRLFPDNLARSCVPLQFRNWVAARRTKKMMREMSGPQFDPEAQKHGWDADALMNDLKFLKKYKGGRMDSLRFKMAHPKQSKTVNTSVTALLAGGGIVAGGVGGLKGRRLS